ncbi:hypothetical protein D3C83_101670 [compost metagenome]
MTARSRFFGPSFHDPPQKYWARGSISGNPPAAWLNEIRSSGHLAAVPLAISEAAASVPSMPTT